ncbi:hypothetical protein R6Q59_033302 [Mikania micrantha]
MDLNKLLSRTLHSFSLHSGHVNLVASVLVSASTGSQRNILSHRSCTFCHEPTIAIAIAITINDGNWFLCFGHLLFALWLIIIYNSNVRVIARLPSKQNLI